MRGRDQRGRKVFPTVRLRQPARKTTSGLTPHQTGPRFSRPVGRRDPHDPHEPALSPTRRLETEILRRRAIATFGWVEAGIGANNWGSPFNGPVTLVADYPDAVPVSGPWTITNTNDPGFNNNAAFLGGVWLEYFRDNNGYKITSPLWNSCQAGNPGSCAGASPATSGS